MPFADDPFLEKYGFRASDKSWLEYGGRLYASKAVVGVATGLSSEALFGGSMTIRPLLHLGFRITDAPPPADSARPGFTPRVEIESTLPTSYAPDPDTHGRGLREHSRLENWLSQRVSAAGLRPVDPGPFDPRFDLAWCDGVGLSVVEVKSLLPTNSAGQLRLGLGQILDYAHHLRVVNPELRPILCVEHEPDRSDHWRAICRRAGVELWWPADELELRR